MLVQLRSSKQLAELVMVNQTPEPQPQALSLAMAPRGSAFHGKAPDLQCSGPGTAGQIWSCCLGKPQACREPLGELSAQG